MAVAFVALSCSAYAIDNEQTTVGGACTTGRDAADWDTIMECVSSAWVRGPLFIGTTTDTCDSNHAGMVSYDSTQNLMRYCNGTAWTYL